MCCHLIFTPYLNKSTNMCIHYQIVKHRDNGNNTMTQHNNVYQKPYSFHQQFNYIYVQHPLIYFLGAEGGYRFPASSLD